MTSTSDGVCPTDAVPPKPLCSHRWHRRLLRTVSFYFFVLRRPSGQRSSFPAGVPEAAQGREGLRRRQGETGKRFKPATCSSETKLEKTLRGARSRPTGRPQRCWEGSLGPGRTVEICSNAENHSVLETNISIRSLQGLMGRDRAVNKPFIYYFGSFITVSFLCLRS